MTIDKGLGVFNGDMGIIKNINTYEETVTVEYDEPAPGEVSICDS